MFNVTLKIPCKRRDFCEKNNKNIKNKKSMKLTKLLCLLRSYHFLNSAIR